MHAGQRGSTMMYSVSAIPPFPSLTPASESTVFMDSGMVPVNLPSNAAAARTPGCSATTGGTAIGCAATVAFPGIN